MAVMKIVRYPCFRSYTNYTTLTVFVLLSSFLSSKYHDKSTRGLPPLDSQWKRDNLPATSGDAGDLMWTSLGGTA